ncbi:IPTL-CTERM sorting domain-containing protein [Brevundimonas sp.]|uniref:IPTL-CTERM sorting domain-containing protein n=1 Tax=Brevundimonas sp. TaxID=1871086 RepID=UPI003D0D6392
MKRFLIILALFAVWLPGQALAQTISQTVGNNAIGGNGLGQSFTATVTGTVTQIEVRSRTNGAATVYFYNGATGSGINSSPGTPVSSQAVVLVDQGSNTTGLQTIVLASPLPIVAGNSYSFAFSAANMAFNTADPYAGGALLTGYDSPFGGFDLVFTATQVAAGPAPVPTLSEWAMILFGLTLAGGAAVILQRRRFAA